MFDLKKFTTLALAGTFAFGAAATTYAAEAPQKELPQAEQPAPQLHQDQQNQKDKMAKGEIIQIDQMGDYEAPDQDKKDQPADLDEQKPAPVMPGAPMIPEQDQKAQQDKVQPGDKELPQEGPEVLPQPEHK